VAVLITAPMVTGETPTPEPALADVVEAGGASADAPRRAGVAAPEGPLPTVGMAPYVDLTTPPLPAMTDVELTLADLWATKISPGEHPISHLRGALEEQGIRPVGSLGEPDDTRRVRVAGLVTHRQRPGTAGGVTFLNLEDETGMLNIVCAEPMWRQFRRVGRNANAMVIRGRVEHTKTRRSVRAF